MTDDQGSKVELTAKDIIIATGSEPTPLPGVEIDNQRILDSTGALSLSEVPKHLVVIGAGVIGLELGSVWRRLGAQVTVVEYLDRICPGVDAEAGKTLQRSLSKQGHRLQVEFESHQRHLVRQRRAAQRRAGGRRHAPSCWKPITCWWPSGVVRTPRAWVWRTSA